MKKIAIVALALMITGCSTLYKPKKTQFYKDGKLVQTFVGRGIFDSNTFFGTYKIWAKQGWKYYDYRCENCEVVETEIR